MTVKLILSVGANRCSGWSRHRLALGPRPCGHRQHARRLARWWAMDDARLQRLEALLRIDERLKSLEDTRPEPRKPWWKNAALLAAYGSLIALVPALVTGVAGWFETRRELELSASKQEHERTLAYLGLAVDPDATEAERAQVLRFLAAQSDDAIGAWARAELALVQHKLDELQTEQAELTAEVATAATKASVAQSQAAELQVQAREDPKLAKAAAVKAAEAEHLSAELQRKRDHADAIATRVGDVPLQILRLRAQAIEPRVDAAPDPTLEGAVPTIRRRIP